MADTASYGLKALVAATRVCTDSLCLCTSDVEIMLSRVNKALDPSHQLDKATYQAICLDLDQNPIADRPGTSSGEKKRDDGKFERVVVKAFRVSPTRNIPVFVSTRSIT